MFLASLKLLNFKNYGDAALSFTKKVNCFTGDNGAGKTNLLDAIYYLCLTKSYFNAVDYQNIRHGEDFFRLDGTFNDDGIYEICCVFQQTKRKNFKKNKVPYDKLSEHIGEFPVVIVTPDDNSLILGGSEERRKFIDNILSQLSREYLDAVSKYTRVLMQRNATLKKFAEQGRFDRSLLLAYEQKMIQYGELVYAERKAMLKNFIPLFQQFYNVVSGEREKVHIDYRSDLNDASLIELLEQNLEKDRMLQRTCGGIHRDDLEFYIEGRPVKKFGSQGQQKSFLISLKLAQYVFMKKDKGRLPLLLLDDIFDKLDHHRVHNVMQFIMSEDFGQIFITDTSRERLSNIFGEETEKVEFFAVEDGKVS